MVFAPAVLDKVYAGVKGKIAAKGAVVGWLFGMALKSGIANFDAGGVGECQCRLHHHHFLLHFRHRHHLRLHLTSTSTTSRRDEQVPRRDRLQEDSRAPRRPRLDDADGVGAARGRRAEVRPVGVQLARPPGLRPHRDGGGHLRDDGARQLARRRRPAAGVRVHPPPRLGGGQLPQLRLAEPVDRKAPRRGAHRDAPRTLRPGGPRPHTPSPHLITALPSLRC